MRHILTSFLTLHWMAIFAILAVACAMDADGGAGTVLASLFHRQGGVSGAEPLWSSASLAVAFCTVACLFLWVFITATFGGGTVSQDAEEIARIAVAAAIGSMTLLLLARAGTSAAPLFSETAMFVAALVASYLAIFAERWSAVSSEVSEETKLHEASKLMATSAAHNSMLSRLSGRAE